MSKLWNCINSINTRKKYKNYLYVIALAVLNGMTGGIIWLVAGQLVLPGIDWLICFVGYPAVFAGFFGGIFYLYTHEF